MDNDINLLEQDLKNNPPETFKVYRGYGSGVEDNLKGFFVNLTEIIERIKYAVSCKFYIEAISLELQYIDYWLRIYYINKNKSTNLRKKEFGKLLKQCQEVGLDETLYKELSEYNNIRVKAIHGFMIGSIKYNELEKFFEKSTKFLAPKVEKYVLENCGEYITNTEGNYQKGDIALNVKSRITSIDEYLNS